MTQRTATMTACVGQFGVFAKFKRWNVEFFDEDGALVRTIPNITEVEARRRVESWEGTLDG